MTLLKVIEETPSSKSLCPSCRWCSVRRSDRSERLLICTKNDPSLRDNRVIVECNDYEKEGSLRKRDMYEMAWFLKTSKNGGAIGFMPRREFVSQFGEEEADKGL